MKIILCTIGKAHEKYVKDGVDNFTKRIGRYFPVEWKLIAPSKQTEEAAMKREEGAAALSLLGKDDYLVALDERGKQMTSVQLSGFVQQRANESTKQMIFLIGGAYGLDEAVLQRAQYKWSLSLLTLPHQLVRLVLAEQVYRACTILRNEKYHH
jgi:23S rRNA (pseudouridine1915-N3)-methyltransferase